MIEQFLPVFGKLEKLLEYREARRAKIFHQFVHPIYTDLELIHNDYRESFSIMMGISKNSSVSDEEFLFKLKEFQWKFRPLRAKVRSIVSCLYGGDELETRNIISGSLSAPDIISTKTKAPGLSTQVKTFVEAVLSYFFPSYNLETPYTLIEMGLRFPKNSEDGWSWRTEARNLLSFQLKHIDSQWEKITKSYATAKVHCIL